MYQGLIDYLNGRSVLILGFGREGRSTYEFIRKHFPQKPIGIADQCSLSIEDENVALITGENYLESINDYDLVMQSPGISMRSINIPKSVEITGQMDLFLRFVECETVGITGTKGKTTTSTLIYEILCAAGKPACLIGNMGVPVFNSIEEIKGKTAVIEMSSHQLESVKASPHIAVLTNIYPEHLDHYKGLNEYINAKLNILKYQKENDFLIINQDQDFSEFFNVKSMKAKIIPVGSKDGDKSEFLKSLTALNERLKGAHNNQNIFFAAAVARCLGISNEAVQSGVENFKGIEHRLEPVGVFKGIKFYNNCIATIPTAVMLDIDALADVSSLIIGGMDRGIDYSDFVESLEKSGIQNLICLPDTGHSIGKELMKRGSCLRIILACDMEQAVESAFKLTDIGRSCLLSPAASSYNRYKNFEEKGRHFKKLVREMGEKIG